MFDHPRSRRFGVQVAMVQIKAMELHLWRKCFQFLLGAAVEGVFMGISMIMTMVIPKYSMVFPYSIYGNNSMKLKR